MAALFPIRQSLFVESSRLGPPFLADQHVSKHAARLAASPRCSLKRLFGHPVIPHPDLHGTGRESAIPQAAPMLHGKSQQWHDRLTVVE